MFCYVCMETVRCFARHEKRIFFFVQIILGLQLHLLQNNIIRLLIVIFYNYHQRSSEFRYNNEFKLNT